MDELISKLSSLDDAAKYAYVKTIYTDFRLNETYRYSSMLFMKNFQQMVPDVVDYKNLGNFLTHFPANSLGTKNFLYVISIYDMDTCTTDNLDLFLRLVKMCPINELKSSDQDILVNFVIRLSALGDVLSTPKTFYYEFYQIIICDLQLSQQHELTQIVLDKNLFACDLLFEFVHKKGDENLIALTENLLELYGFDIQQHSSSVDFALNKILAKTHDKYLHRIDQETLAMAALKLLFEKKLAKTNVGLHGICKKILQDSAKSGVDLNVLILGT
jgi:hypothetical protein